MGKILSPFQQALILSVCPKGWRIVGAHYFQEAYQPGPIGVCAAGAKGGERSLVLRLSRRGGVVREMRLYGCLGRLGLPVPRVLAGPVSDSANPELGPMAVCSLLPGKDLQKWSEGSVAELEWAGQLLIEAVDRLRQMTAMLEGERCAEGLPRRTMAAELQGVTARGGEWLGERVFVEGVEILAPVLAAISTPLVFSNGDYQPANFLFDGSGLTGFVDFESACFEDPHIGFAKYPIYDLHPLNKAGLVGRYLRAGGISEGEFAPRLALRCLQTLQREISVSGPGDEGYRKHVLALLGGALSLLK